MKYLARLITLAAILGLADPATAQSYPVKPVRIVVPVAPVGATHCAPRSVGHRRP